MRYSSILRDGDSFVSGHASFDKLAAKVQRFCDKSSASQLEIQQCVFCLQDIPENNISFEGASCSDCGILFPVCPFTFEISTPFDDRRTDLAVGRPLSCPNCPFSLTKLPIELLPNEDTRTRACEQLSALLFLGAGGTTMRGNNTSIACTYCNVSMVSL